MSISIIFLIIFLVILSGVIAYVGDWLGSYVGKKRLSLFGARPKRTGRMIGIGAGIAIMIVTLGVSSLAFRNAWRTLFAAQVVGERLRELEVQERRLTSTVNTLETKLGELQTQNETLTSTNDDLLASNNELSSANQSLSADVTAKTALVTKLGQDVDSLTIKLDDQAKKLNAITQQLDARGKLTYRPDELIATTVIDAQDINAINEELALFITEATTTTAQRGAGEVSLRSDQFNSLAQDATATPGPDVIVLRSDNNQFGSAPVSVNIESFENQKVFSAGQLLVSQRILVQSQSQIRDIRTDVINLWQMARTKLYNFGVVDSISPESYTESPSTEGFTNELLRMNGQVTLGLIVTEDIYISGPAKLEFTIVNN
jgi:Protein of unknown function (DUF3084)